MKHVFKIKKYLKLILSIFLMILVSETPMVFGANSVKNFSHKKVSAVKTKTDENEDIFEDITVDCAFSVGKWCICAQHLKNNNLRKIASPLDWMRSSSLDVAAHLFETKFEDFFKNVKVTCEKRSNGDRTVYDTKNHIESIHYMPSKIPFDQAYKEFKETMDKRAKKVDEMISSSKSILLLNCRNYPGRPAYKNSTDKELKSFAVRFAKAYPNLKKIYLIDIHNDKNEGIKKRIIHSGEKIKIIQYKFKNIDKKQFFPPFGNKEAWDKILKNVKLTPEKNIPIQKNAEKEPEKNTEEK